MDLRHVLDLLERLGAITREQGMADPVFLDTALDEPPSRSATAHRDARGTRPVAGLPPGRPGPECTARAKELRAELASGPVELIRLTDLGTRAVRRRLIAQGRSAPLVGELTHAPAAGLLGVLAQEYDPEHAEAELAARTAAHDSPGHARRLLLEAVRTTPFRTRAAALLDTLATALPDGRELLRSLRGDADLAPTALTVLTQRGALDHEDLTDTEAALMAAESLLQLLDLGGEQGPPGSPARPGPRGGRDGDRGRTHLRPPRPGRTRGAARPRRRSPSRQSGSARTAECDRHPGTAQHDEEAQAPPLTSTRTLPSRHGCPGAFGVGRARLEPAGGVGR